MSTTMGLSLTAAASLVVPNLRDNGVRAFNTKPTTRASHGAPSRVVALGSRARVSSLVQRVPSRGRVVRVYASGDDGKPEEARESIILAQSMYKEGKHEEALTEFERALSLPGSGIKQFKDKPALVSNGEKISALYNISCCHCRLGNEYLALVSLAGALEAGFEDWTTLMADPELELVRTAEKTPGLLAMYDRELGEKLKRIQNGEAPIQERTGMESFMKGDWLWKKLTKTRPPTDDEWADISTGPRSGGPRK